MHREETARGLLVLRALLRLHGIERGPDHDPDTRPAQWAGLITLASSWTEAFEDLRLAIRGALAERDGRRSLAHVRVATELAADMIDGYHFARRLDDDAAARFADDLEHGVCLAAARKGAA